MLKNIVFIITMTVLVSGAFALPLEELVPNHAARLRQSQDPIIETQLSNPSLRLIPEDANFRQVVDGVIRTLEPRVIVETMYLYQKPISAHTSANTWNSVQKTGIYNQLLALSTLQGIQYFSASRGTMRTFFEISHVVNSSSSRERVPDPVYQVPPASLSIYARQKDLTFGDNIYQYNYNITNNSIYFIQENITPLTYGIITAIGRNNLRTALAVFDCGDSVLIYTAFLVKAASVPGMGNRIGDSFSNRAQAMITWFTGRMDEFYEK